MQAGALGSSGAARRKKKGIRIDVPIEEAAPYQEAPRSSPLSASGLAQLRSGAAELDEAVCGHWQSRAHAWS